MRKRIEKMFKEYESMKRKVDLLKFQITRFKGISDDDVISTLCFSSPQSERVQSSEISDKTAKVAINYRMMADRINNEYYDSLLNQYEDLEEEVAFFEYCIRTLRSQLAEVITDMVINKKPWSEIENKYGISHGTVNNYKKKAIAEMVGLYVVREKQIEQYILS